MQCAIACSLMGDGNGIELTGPCIQDSTSFSSYLNPPRKRINTTQSQIIADLIEKGVCILDTAGQGGVAQLSSGRNGDVAHQVQPMLTNCPVCSGPGAGSSKSSPN